MTIYRKGTLTREGWFEYEDGPEYKDPLELQKAARLMPSIPIIAAHPKGMFADNAETVIGRALNNYDHQEQAITTTYEFWEDRLTPEQEQALTLDKSMFPPVSRARWNPMGRVTNKPMSY